MVAPDGGEVPASRMRINLDDHVYTLLDHTGTPTRQCNAQIMQDLIIIMPLKNKAT